MESAISQCVQQGVAQTDQYGQELTQADQQMFAQLQADATKASAAYGALAGIFGEEIQLTSNLPVPPRLAALKQQVLSAFETVTRDATAGEAITGEPIQALALQVSAGVSAVSSQVDSLVIAMRG